MLKALQQSDLKVFKLVFTSCSPRFSKSNTLFELLDIMPKVSMSKSLLLGHWYEIMVLYYVKSVLTKISASRQDRRVLQKSKIIISEHMGHATDF